MNAIQYRALTRPCSREMRAWGCTRLAIWTGTLIGGVDRCAARQWRAKITRFA